MNLTGINRKPFYLYCHHHHHRHHHRETDSSNRSSGIRTDLCWMEVCLLNYKILCQSWRSVVYVQIMYVVLCLCKRRFFAFPTVSCKGGLLQSKSSQILSVQSLFSFLIFHRLFSKIPKLCLQIYQDNCYLFTFLHTSQLKFPISSDTIKIT